MASDPSFVTYVLDQLREAGDVTAKKMFGEYGLYLGGKMVALVCDDRLYVKPTEPGLAFVGAAPAGIPYPNAKPHFEVTEKLEDRAWLGELFGLTAAALPMPKPKKPRRVQA